MKKRKSEVLSVVSEKKVVTLYAHESTEGQLHEGSRFGLKDRALANFSSWGYEIEFTAQVDMATGAVKLLTVNGNEIKY